MDIRHNLVQLGNKAQSWPRAGPPRAVPSLEQCLQQKTSSGFGDAQAGILNIQFLPLPVTFLTHLLNTPEGNQSKVTRGPPSPSGHGASLCPLLLLSQAPAPVQRLHQGAGFAHSPGRPPEHSTKGQGQGPKGRCLSPRLTYRLAPQRTPPADTHNSPPDSQVLPQLSSLEPASSPGGRRSKCFYAHFMEEDTEAFPGEQSPGHKAEGGRDRGGDVQQDTHLPGHQTSCLSANS